MKPLSDDELRFVQNVHPARANGHCLRGRNCNPLLRYHTPQLYFVCNHLNFPFTGDNISRQRKYSGEGAFIQTGIRDECLGKELGSRLQGSKWFRKR